MANHSQVRKIKEKVFSYIGKEEDEGACFAQKLTAEKEKFEVVAASH